MSLRRIRGVVKDRGGLILAVCLREPGGPVVNLAEVIDDITTGRNSYVVDAGAGPARVGVVHEGGRVYLRTSPDADRANNLDALPDCGTLPPIGAVPVRRNVAHVGADERRRLRDAILELNHRSYPQGAGPPDPVTMWFKQDEVHQATHVHKQASFLAWHRVLVNEFEAKLQEIDPALALHYWDWTAHPRRARTAAAAQSTSSIPISWAATGRSARRSGNTSSTGGCRPTGTSTMLVNRAGGLVPPTCHPCWSAVSCLSLGMARPR